MTTHHAARLARLTLRTIAATIHVIVADPRLALHLGYVLRHTGSCLGKCTPACANCMTRRLAAAQGFQPTERQRRLLLLAAAPVRQAMRES